MIRLRQWAVFAGFGSLIFFSNLAQIPIVLHASVNSVAKEL
jgi:hypothetical protein